MVTNYENLEIQIQIEIINEILNIVSPKTLRNSFNSASTTTNGGIA